MEKWIPVEGWHGKYLISDKGRFKSIKGKFSKKCPDGYITLGTIDITGYRVVTMRRPGHYERLRVHTIMGNHFLVRPTNGKNLCMNHIDGNKLNNNIKNLEWTTLGENVKHAVRIGIFNIKGERHPLSKLTESQVIEMRKIRSEQGLTYDQIGKMFGVCRRQTSDVIRGINWGWLQ